MINKNNTEQVNNFDKYASKETEIVMNWINSNSWLKNIFVKYIPENTAFHDGVLILKINGKEKKIVVQVKEEERYWFDKTGNLGLDYLSAFTFKKENNYDYIKYNWVESKDIDKFLKSINMKKFGKLITCDADIHIFFVKDKLCKAYSNKLLQSEKFINYLKSNFKLRINNKKEYKLNDDWESAAFFIKSDDSELEKCLILSIDDIQTKIGEGK